MLIKFFSKFIFIFIFIFVFVFVFVLLSPQFSAQAQRISKEQVHQMLEQLKVGGMISEQDYKDSIAELDGISNKGWNKVNAKMEGELQQAAPRQGPGRSPASLDNQKNIQQMEQKINKIVTPSIQTNSPIYNPLPTQRLEDKKSDEESISPETLDILQRKW